MLYPTGFYYVKKPKRFVILSSDKSSERNLSNFFDIKKPRRIEHLQSEEPFSSDPYFSTFMQCFALGSCCSKAKHCRNVLGHVLGQKNRNKNPSFSDKTVVEMMHFYLAFARQKKMRVVTAS